VRLQREGVTTVDACDLHVGAERWQFADDCRAQISEHWRVRSAENPKFFNGTVFVLIAGVIEGNRFRGQLAQTDFASYLYWRESGFSDPAVRDCFGTAVIRAADGGVLLARQREGHINTGLSYLPGGFIDVRDTTEGQVIDVGASILREITEETGLGTSDLAVQPGLLVSCAGPLVSLATVYQSELDAADLARAIDAYIAADADGELEGVEFVQDLSSIDPARVPPYARQLLQRVLPAT
jgi:8-oxo-dGTP pyrophosphatase MutT (NUDIX family)